MNEVSENSQKCCIRCFEKINEKAEKCPHCQEWQTGFFSFNNQVFSFGASAFVGLIFLRFVFFPFFNGMANDCKKEISVSKKEFFYTIENNQPFLTVMGILKNNSNKTLSQIKVEANFFDSEKKLIDTFSEGLYGLILQPNSESNFKARNSAIYPKEKYSTFEVVIKWAQEKDRFF